MLALISQAKDWWLMRQYLKLWEKASFEMVLATLKVAIQQRGSTIFHECLFRCRLQFGGWEEAEKVWAAWPAHLKETWEFTLKKNLTPVK